MKALLVLSHPLDDSLNATLAGTAAACLRQMGHEVIERNLYKAAFQPELTKDERKSYYSGFDMTGITSEAAELRDADVLVLVFPTWWFSMPAMLKGWIDRVWAPGVAYDHAPDMGAIRPRLHQLKRVIAITTLGAPWWVDRLVMWQPVKRVLKWAILKPCAPQAKLHFVSFYACEKKTDAQVMAMKDKVTSTIRTSIAAA
jgi:putative NADPH-quinone reductase